jgi:fatty-acyl-CoA synthase
VIELDWLKKWNLYSPEAIALKDGESGQEYTYKEFYHFANVAAHLLQSEYGIQKGDRIAVLATNELEYVFLFYAAQRLGAILVPINFRLTQREVNHIVQDCSPKLLMYQAEYSDVVQQLSFQPPHKMIFKSDGSSTSSSPYSFAEMIQKMPFQEVSFSAGLDSPCMIIYTSGTTGSPKGALLTQKMMFWNSINTTMRLNLCQNDCTVIFLPFFHTGGWNVLTTPFIHRGAKVVFLKKFDGDKILQLSAQEKATILFGVPTTMDMMARSSLFEKIDLSAVRYAIVGGEPMPLELIKTWHQKGIPIRQGYGLTEFGPNVFSLNEQDAIRKIGSIGFANFYIESKVVDENGQELGPDQIGELVLRGPSCMAGYWNNPKATSETIVNDWLHTGDLVRRDSEGYYYVVGRKKDMYKSGGENVYPAELEQVLRSVPGVREVAVIGVPDPKWGEVGKAFVVRENPKLTMEILQNHCIANLAKFKIPKYFTFLESLPKGDSGKILKKNLKETST